MEHTREEIEERFNSQIKQLVESTNSNQHNQIPTSQQDQWHIIEAEEGEDFQEYYRDNQRVPYGIAIGIELAMPCGEMELVLFKDISMNS